VAKSEGEARTGIKSLSLWIFLDTEKIHKFPIQPFKCQYRACPTWCQRRF